MFTKRATAIKVLIKDLINGEYVHREGESDYVNVRGVNVSRVNIIATIVNKFVNNERKSGSIIIDDGSEVISVRVWENEFHLIDKLVIGQLIRIIGRIRSYNNEVYLTPEIIKVVNPNWLVIHKLDLMNNKSNEVEITSKGDDLKDRLFNYIKNKQDEGATIEELTSLAGDKKSCVNALMSLIDDDLIFEPRAGRYKVL